MPSVNRLDQATFDFIIVGAGPAGAILASELSKTKEQPSILLLEAGGRNDTNAARADAERWIHRVMFPDMNWGYQTAPMEGFDGRTISYDRGKGLGGSTAINFSIWTLGPRDDYDEIARIAGDEEWGWTKIQQRFRRIESYSQREAPVSEKFEEYMNPDPKIHGQNGPIKVGFPKVWEPQGKELVDIFLANGAERNLDVNSGDPIGLALAVSSAHNGRKSTAADVLLDAASNLHIIVDITVERVLLDGSKAVGVVTSDGQKLHARKEIILCAGALDTPRLLLHSGIGPPAELEKYGIPLVKANKNVGEHFKDHHHIHLASTRVNALDQRTQYYKSKELQAAARKTWEHDGSGPLSEFGTAIGIAFERLDNIQELEEFQSLPKAEQDRLLEPTIPHYEYMLNGPWLPHFLDPENATAGAGMFVFVMNQQSTGSVRLQSSDPKQPLSFNPNYFSHPYDRRVAIEATRRVLGVLNSPEFQNGTVTIDGPKSDSDEDILAFWRARSASTWHMMGSARMGKDERDAVVNSDLKVFGIDKLRVADMSVIPIVSNNHTQTTAYLVGLTAADKIMREYSLNI